MKKLVVFYSRSGNTQKVALEIARSLRADVDEIIDLKDRTRKIIGWLIAGKDASQKKLTEIKFKKDPKNYDLVIIGTPIWAWTMTPAIRTYLSKNKIKKVAFFSTAGSRKNKAFEEMAKLSKRPVATCCIEERDIKANRYKESIKEFCDELK